MKEDLIHYLWRVRKFDHRNLKTTGGERIIIESPGEHNHDAGPDFSNARIRIGDILWAGNIEMHVRASDWYLHKHDEDDAYNNVILHVVFDEDQKVINRNGASIACLELKTRIPRDLVKSYFKLKNNTQWIACQNQLHVVSQLTKDLWIDRLLVERLERKTERIIQNLKKNNNDWETTFYHVLARGFGVKVNSDPFERLVQSVPLTILAKHRNSLFQLEALLFGQAGMLDQHFKETYPMRLQKEYTFLQRKYQLCPIKAASWKFLRMRPAGFPTIRIALFAKLIHQSNYLFSKILVIKNIRDIENMFELKISNYWQTHYVFEKVSVQRNKSLGKNTIHLLTINTIVPFLFHYGKTKSDDTIKKRALDLLEELSPEKNAVISKWKALGMNPISAYQSQALLQLKATYCDKKNCLNCRIGNAVLTGRRKNEGGRLGKGKGEERESGIQS